MGNSDSTPEEKRIYMQQKDFDQILDYFKLATEVSKSQKESVIILRQQNKEMKSKIIELEQKLHINNRRHSI